jgi:hypothetical protein
VAEPDPDRRADLSHDEVLVVRVVRDVALLGAVNR